MVILKTTGKKQFGSFNAGVWIKLSLAVILVFWVTGCAQRKIIFMDTFSTDQFSAGYRWFDEDNPDSRNLTDEPGWLRIIAGPRQDLWAESWKRGAPLMLRPAPANDFAADSFVSASPLANPSQPINTQIGLFVFKEDKQDGNHDCMFFGLTRQEFDTSPLSQNGLMVTKTTGGASSMVAGHALAEDAVFLRIKRVGNQWKFYWKLHHDDAWNLLTTINNLPLSSFEVGNRLFVEDTKVKLGLKAQGRKEVESNDQYMLKEP